MLQNNRARVITLDNLEIKISEDSDKKLLVGNWDLIDNKKILNDSNTKLADPRFVTAENIFNVEKDFFKVINSDFNEIQIE